MWTRTFFHWIVKSLLILNIVWTSSSIFLSSYISITFGHDLWLPHSPAEGPNRGICYVLVNYMCPWRMKCKMVIKLRGNLPHLHKAEKQYKWVCEPTLGRMGYFCDLSINSCNLRTWFEQEEFLFLLQPLIFSPRSQNWQWVEQRPLSSEEGNLQKKKRGSPCTVYIQELEGNHGVQHDTQHSKSRG